MHPILRERRALLAYLAAWLALSVLPASILAAPGEGRLLAALAAAAPANLLGGLAALPLYYLCRAMPVRPGNLDGVLRVHALLAAIWTGCWWGLVAAAALALGWAGVPGPAAAVGQRWAALLAVGLSLYAAVVLFYSLVASSQRAHASEKQALAASLRAQEAQLALLKAQIHPHFLFNSLNAVSALTVEDPRMARELCVQLADFLRGSLALGERGMVSLSEELALARAYLAVEQVRLGDRLTLDLRMDPQAGEVQVPALLLQPLVENAITHGIATCARGGTLSLEARVTPGTLVVTIANPFDPQAPPRRRKESGLGLANVSRRLAARYFGASLTTRRDADRFVATLILPLSVPEGRS